MVQQREEKKWNILYFEKHKENETLFRKEQL